MKLKTLLCAAAISLGIFSSCNSDGPSDQQKFTLDYDSAKLIMGYKTGESSSDILTIATAPTIKMERDILKSTMTLTLTSLYIPGSGSMNITTPPIPYSIADNQIRVTNQDIDAVTTQLKGLTFIGDNDWFTLQFTVGNNFVVINNLWTYYQTNLQAHGVLYDAQLYVTSSMNPDGFEFNNADYFISYDMKEQKADLYMLGIKFASAMPQQNMVVKGIPFEMTTTGYTFLATEDINPYIVGNSTPYPQYVIKNFKGNIPYNGRNGSLTFDCSDQNWGVQIRNIRIGNPYY